MKYWQQPSSSRTLFWRRNSRTSRSRRIRRWIPQPGRRSTATCNVNTCQIRSIFRLSLVSKLGQTEPEEDVPLHWPVVLGVEEEVRADDGDTDGDGQEDEEHCKADDNFIETREELVPTEKHEAVDIVNFVSPEGGEYEVHLYEDWAKWKNSCNR